MATITTINYATTTAVTVSSWDSLGAGSWASATQVDNTANQYIDVLVGGVLATDNAVFALANETFKMYILATYSDTDTDVGGALDATGAISTAGEALTEGIAGEFLKENIKLLDIISVGETTLTVAEFIHWGPVSIAQVFGGIIPRKWTLVLHNDTTGILETTGTTADYTGITFTNT